MHIDIQIQTEYNNNKFKILWDYKITTQKPLLNIKPISITITTKRKCQKIQLLNNQHHVVHKQAQHNSNNKHTFQQNIMGSKNESHNNIPKQQQQTCPSLQSKLLYTHTTTPKSQSPNKPTKISNKKMNRKKYAGNGRIFTCKN